MVTITVTLTADERFWTKRRVRVYTLLVALAGLGGPGRPGRAGGR
ncbi:MAG: hypothetical protein ACR2G2_02030 [Pseudonocardia sp.]